MQILKRLESLRAREHDATVALIEGLVECHRTRAHVDAGYRSVFQLLVERLKYSPAAASRRFAAMRCAMRCPFVIDMLRGHRTSLTALAKVASSLESCPDPDALLRSIDGLTPDDVDTVVAGLRPVPKPAERARPIAVARPARNNGSELGMDWGSSASEDTVGSSASGSRPRVGTSSDTSEPARAAGPATAVDRPTSPAAPTPSEARVSVSFTMTREDFDALQAARTRLSRTRPKPLTLEETVRTLVAYHDEHRPKRRRRSNPPTARRTRHIPRATREAVFERDGHRCAFVAPEGTRCTATHDLQIDHVEPDCEGARTTSRTSGCCAGRTIGGWRSSCEEGLAPARGRASNPLRRSGAPRCDCLLHCRRMVSVAAAFRRRAGCTLVGCWARRAIRYRDVNHLATTNFSPPRIIAQ